jgi:hypothetical protein
MVARLVAMIKYGVQQNIVQNPTQVAPCLPAVTLCTLLVTPPCVVVQAKFLQSGATSMQSSANAMLNAATSTLANVRIALVVHLFVGCFMCIADSSWYFFLSLLLMTIQMGGASEEKVKRTMQQYYTAVTLSVKNILQAAEFLNASTAVEEVEVHSRLSRSTSLDSFLRAGCSVLTPLSFLLSPSHHPSHQGRFQRQALPRRRRWLLLEALSVPISTSGYAFSS